MSNDPILYEGEIITGGLPAFLKDTGERAVKTFVQTLALFLVAGVTVTAVPWGTALGASGLATLATVLLSLSTATITAPNAVVESLIRAARTFIATVIGAIPLTVDAAHASTFADVNWAQAAGLAGTAALISLATSVGSLPLGPVKGSPSLTSE